jgi:HSP20 family protein
MALVRFEPFREIDRLFQSAYGASGLRPMAMPMDARRVGDRFLIELDLPGVDVERIEVSVEGDTLTVTAERPQRPIAEGTESLIAERPMGTFRRQVFLGENLDTANIEAEYRDGVLSVTIPVAEHAKPRRIEVSRAGHDRELIGVAG